MLTKSFIIDVIIMLHHGKALNSSSEEIGVLPHRSPTMTSARRMVGVGPQHVAGTTTPAGALVPTPICLCTARWTATATCTPSLMMNSLNISR